jgi:hypothetical protein
MTGKSRTLNSNADTEQAAAMKTNIYQIFYDERTRGQVDPGFIGLDNIDNPRADWREYWAIRNFFLNNAIDDDQLYGFLSPSFHTKTGLTASRVDAFIQANPGHEVYTFSPFIQDATCYLNVFEQGNLYHPGLVEVAQSYLKDIQLEVNLEELVMDFRSMVYCNYIIAKPSFWRTWFALSEKLFDIAENEHSELSNHLNSLTIYRLPVGMKVFLVERIASLTLALCPEISVCHFDPLTMPWSEPIYQTYAKQMMLLDKVKKDYLQTGDKVLLASFYALRGAILLACKGESARGTRDGFIKTPKITSPQLLYVCFSDKSLPFAYPKHVSTIQLGLAQGPGKVNLRDLSPEWQNYHEELGWLAGCFALKSYILATGLQVRRVGLCLPDTFVSNRRIAAGERPRHAAADVLGVRDVADTSLTDVMAPETRDFLIGEFRTLGNGKAGDGYFNEYASTHHGEDLLRFTAIAVELGVLQQDEVMPFFSETRLCVNGVGMGVFPTEFWIRTISSIEAVVRECFSRHVLPADGAREQAWALCAERLGSYLLLQHLENAYRHVDWQRKFIGQVNRVEIQEQVGLVLSI